MTETERPSPIEYEYLARRVAEGIGDDSLIGAILTNYADAYHLVSEEEREGVAKLHIELLRISKGTREKKYQRGIFESLEKPQSKLEFLLALTAAHNMFHLNEGGAQ